MIDYDKGWVWKRVGELRDSMKLNKYIIGLGYISIKAVRFTKRRKTNI